MSFYSMYVQERVNLPDLSVVFADFECFCAIVGRLLVPALMEKNSVKPESQVSAVSAVGGVEKPLVDSECERTLMLMT